MNNAIEEMMRTAGIEPEIYETPGRDWDEDGLASWYIEKIYPDFTAEKQLEIIKLIGWASPKDIEREELDFVQALAQLTTELMKVGELDREKVKEILER